MADNRAESGTVADDAVASAALGASLAFDRLARIAILAAGYSLTGIVGLSLAVPPGYATAVWPPSGLALAALLLWGQRVWPGIWIGSFLVNVAVALTNDADLGLVGFTVAASVGIGSTIQALVTAWALERWVGVARMFEVAPATLAFAGIATLGCLIAATWGAATLVATGVIDWSGFLDSWQTWWLGDLIGMLVFAPLFLTWRQSLHIGRSTWRVVEVFSVFAVLALVTALVFVENPPALARTNPLTFLPLPFLVWIACRFRPVGVAIGATLVSTIAVAATANGTGPFAVGEPTAQSLLMLQAFIGLTTVMGLTLAAAVTGHRESVSALRDLSIEMEQLALTDELTGLRNRRGFLVLADQALRMARRTQAKCALVFIDLDGLKRINDSRGHAAGDAMIADAGRVLGRVFRESDIVARVGGDEFAVFALLDENDGASTVSARLHAEIDRFNALAVPTMRLSMSVGVEELPCTSDTPLDILLSRADRAMYEKKRRTGGRLRAYLR